MTLGVVDEDLVQYCHIVDDNHHVLGEDYHTLDVVLFLSLDYPVTVVFFSLLDLVVVVEVTFLYFCAHVQDKIEFVVSLEVLDVVNIVVFLLFEGPLEELLSYLSAVVWYLVALCW